MLTKEEIIKMLVGLEATNDLDLVNDDKVLSIAVCSKSDRAKVKQMASLLSELFLSFNYEKSPEFQKSILGKSTKYREMKLRLISDPTKTKNYKRRLADAFINFNTKELGELIKTGEHEKVKLIYSIMEEISNPSD